MIKINNAILPSDSEFSVSPTLGINQMAQEKRRAGEVVYHLGFGESPFPAHPILQEALANNAHHTGYAQTAGLPNLRRLVRRYHCAKFQLDLDRYECMVAPGSKLLIYAAQACVEGDILLPNPSWVSYAPQARMLDQESVWVPTELSDEGMYMDPQILKKTIVEARKAGQNPTKLLINTPNNPTGLTMSADNLKALAAVAREEQLLVISDEIYAQTHYQKNHVSIARFAPERTIVTSGLSKHLSLGGWRLGMALIPKDISGLFMAMNNFASETWSAVAAPIQHAVVAAYEDQQELETYVSQCAEIHSGATSYLADILKNLGISCPRAQGAFYLYPDFAAYREKLEAKGVTTAAGLSRYLAQHYNIMALPGHCFGATAETLTLRLAPCDYDGAAALTARAAAPELDLHTFVTQHLPQIKGAGEAFQRFIQDLDK